MILLFTISGKHIEITEAIKTHAQEKTSKLPKYYNSINQIEVIVDGSQGGSLSVEIIARAEHGKVFVGTDTGQDIYRCIDMAAHKLERQLGRAKGKERDNKYPGGHPADRSEESEPT
ncbi:MAG: ribosomal subunit interface protein [Planctomycetes bacterium RBG_16_55_9]|nr:MAG: ribosomal subunit interface protein [Planctomycetes bacterium RBG_16_55_9]